MKLWIGGIIDAAIADDFRLLRNHLEEKVNEIIADINYGPGVSTWDVILVVSTTPPDEYTRYNKKNGETDVRIIINFDSFLEANFAERLEILGQGLLSSIEGLSKKKIVDFDFFLLKKDVNGVIEQH